MRTNEERIAAMHRRAAELERADRVRKVRIINAAGVAACLAVIAAMAAVMPGLSEGMTAAAENSGMYASIFSGSSMAGFLVIGIVAFLLGAAVTIFCFRLKKWLDEKDREADE